MVNTPNFIAGINALRTGGVVSVNDLAAGSGIGRVHLSMILNGKQKSVTLDQAFAIAEVVGLSVEEICEKSAETVATCA